MHCLDAAKKKKSARQVKPVFRHRRVEWKESAHRQEANDCQEERNKNGAMTANPPKRAEKSCNEHQAEECLQFTPRRGVQTFEGKAVRVGLDVAFHVQTPRENNQAGVLRNRARSNNRPNE